MHPAEKGSPHCCPPRHRPAARQCCKLLLPREKTPLKSAGHSKSWLTGRLGLTSPWRRAVTAIPSSSHSPPVDGGSSSNSSLGLPWASSAGSREARCKEELPVSSYLFKATSHNFAYREKGFAIHCFPSASSPGTSGLLRTSFCTRVQLQQKKGPP